jgi:hypothetical protein
MGCFHLTRFFMNFCKFQPSFCPSHNIDPPYLSILYSRVGRFFTKLVMAMMLANIYLSSPDSICILYGRTPFVENRKRMLWLEEVMTFSIIHYIRVQKIFLTMWAHWVSKDAEFYVHFKKLTLLTNAPKKVIPGQRFSSVQRGSHTCFSKNVKYFLHIDVTESYLFKSLLEP